MREDFYRAFEEKYYAPFDVIKKMRMQYLPFIKKIASLYEGSSTYDLGCGRGEWLQLMLESGFKPLGVDLDIGMLESCYEMELPAKQGDGVEFLATLPDDSQAVVTAFHVVEHISFEQLEFVISEALRVLKDGGLLIMETPNPENIIVATRNFYLDPTHKRPIPSELLSFLTEHSGFIRNKIFRLQEAQELVDNIAPTLNNVLGGVSPDYSVIAQKKAPKKILNQFDKLFELEQGLSLSTLAGRFDNRFNQAEAKAGQAEAKAGQAEAKAGQAEAKAGQAEAKAGQAEAIARQAMDAAHQAEAVAHRAEEQLMAIYNSRSWRITQPLRAGADAARWFKRGTIAWLTFAPQSRPRRSLRLALMHLKLYVSRRPRLKHTISKCLQPFPRLHERLRKVGATQAQPVGQSNHEGTEHLTPHARRIYHDLKAAIEQRQREQN
jgi:O-antigen chain-terminating methyltransferase